MCKNESVAGRRSTEGGIEHAGKKRRGTEGQTYYTAADETVPISKPKDRLSHAPLFS